MNLFTSGGLCLGLQNFVLFTNWSQCIHNQITSDVEETSRPKPVYKLKTDKLQQVLVNVRAY